MDILKCLKSFKVIVDQQSFTKASIALDISLATLSKQISWLEKRYGYALLDRETRQHHITPAGQVVYDLAERCQQDIEAVNQEISTQLDGEPQGMLRIGAPSSFSTSFLMPLFNEFTKKHPKAKLAIVATDSPYLLLEDEVDFSICAIPIKHPQIQSATLCSMPRGVFASPEYLKQYGVPTGIKQLTSHHVLVNNNPIWKGISWSFGDKKHIQIPVKPYFITNNNNDLIQAALLDMGLIWSMKILVQQYLDSSKLIELTLDKPAAAGELFYYHMPCHKDSLTRTFAKFLEDKFKQ